jgi:predicted PurR-regulated permease PerM
MSTLGGTYVSIATPQPGTTNTPFPAGPIPPFVPVVTTIESDHAALIVAQSLLVDAILIKIHANLVEINKAIREIDAYQKGMPESVANLSPNVMLWSVNKNIQSVVTAASASNQIKTNNFSVAIKKQSGDNPKLPPEINQLTSEMASTQLFTSTSQATEAIATYASSGASSIATFITSTATYKTVLQYFETIKKRLLNLIYPPTADDVKSSGIAVAGIPVVGK